MKDNKRKNLLQPEIPKKVLLLGSGGLSIGQAGEFDYSGTQAVKALLEEGCEVLIVNPNIATVQTNPIEGVKVFLYPVEPHWVEKVIEKEKPDAIVAGFGGQTALNCLLALEDQGILKKHNLENLGTTTHTLRLTEDRDLFARTMEKIGIPIPPSRACSDLASALEAGNEIGYPVIARAAYALGGLGSGFANNAEELEALVTPALVDSPQVLVEKSLKGWKEVEYEIMRDSCENSITICNMENFDPLGIHTGDSIVVCPSQSLSDDEYQILRNASLKMVDHLKIVGECNAQFALDPHSNNFFVIEVNARLSRSSALASKASGYPIAYIAAKVILGYSLLDLKNPVTGITYSFFEPALDYITVKIPRWDLTKFRGASRKLGSTMKSVGEVMAIGRTFPESLQKAVRMVTEDALGISSKPVLASAGDLEEPTDTRLFSVLDALRGGLTIEDVHEKTAIDKWFLHHLARIARCEKELEDLGAGKHLSEVWREIDADTWRRWKTLGMSDQQIASSASGGTISGAELERVELNVRAARLAVGVKPVVKKIDTTAGEYPSPSNYLYMTYGGKFDDPLDSQIYMRSAMILGSGAYRIGTSVEFDWGAVTCSETMRERGWRSIIVNCNPETVSTDYNNSDRLYFEELSLERILDIYQFENCGGVVTSMGGQLPNKLALGLASAGVRLLGHSAETIDMAEDRNKFSAMLDSIGIDQPRWVSATTKKDIEQFIEKVGFPVLVRPSFVLSGAAMAVATDEKSLEDCMRLADKVNKEHPVVISEFLLGAAEIELDGVARGGKILTAIVSEHIENAGVHSGDATMVVPAQNLYVETVRRVRKAGRLIAEKLGLNGPFNMQFLAKSNHIKVIECNARAARSFPFVSKVVGFNLARLSTQVMLGERADLERLGEDDLNFVGVKAPMFSFKRLLGADPVLGVEMASTGEVGCIGTKFQDALLLALEASGIKKPKKGILISIGSDIDRAKFLSVLPGLVGMDLPLYATHGTAKFFAKQGFEMQVLARPDEKSDLPDVITHLRAGTSDLVINVSRDLGRKDTSFGGDLRQSVITNVEKAIAFVESLTEAEAFVESHELLELPKFLGARHNSVDSYGAPLR